MWSIKIHIRFHFTHSPSRLKSNLTKFKYFWFSAVHLMASVGDYEGREKGRTALAGGRSIITSDLNHVAILLWKIRLQLLSLTTPLLSSWWGCGDSVRDWKPAICVTSGTYRSHYDSLVAQVIPRVRHWGNSMNGLLKPNPRGFPRRRSTRHSFQRKAESFHRRWLSHYKRNAAEWNDHDDDSFKSNFNYLF